MVYYEARVNELWVIEREGNGNCRMVVEEMVYGN